ncbi:MAG: DinB family protein [Rhodoferax sp.]|nr:DinB family protein [Rhodoferax sp.]MDP3653287.1 DinB family protein [Rhodoferax sp.]
MDAHTHFAMLARYNLWATQRLLDSHVAPLSEQDYRRDCGLFFKSIHGTLNHLLVGEHGVWFRRFSEGASPQVALDQEVETDRAQLRQRLLDGARAWQPLIASWSADRFDGTLDYVNLSGKAMSLPFAATLAHVFNHGTHHRGQITAALTASGRVSPELDLIDMLQCETS